MRRAHDPSRLRGRRAWCRRDPQHKAGDAGGLCGQGQFAARHEVELPRLAPDIQHHGAERIAGERVGRGPQRALAIGRAHCHQTSRIKAKLGEPAHRQRAGFKLGKILPHPDQRPAGRDPPGQPCDEAGRHGALMSLAKHLVHRGHRKSTAQHSIRFRMAERHALWGMQIAMRLDAFDVAAQSCERVRARPHAPLPLVMVTALVRQREPTAGSIVHDMF